MADVMGGLLLAKVELDSPTSLSPSPAEIVSNEECAEISVWRLVFSSTISGA